MENAPKIRLVDTASADLRTLPWPHLVIDCFLANDVLAYALDEVASKEYEFEIEQRGSGRIEYSLLESEALWRAVYSRETMRLLAGAFGVAPLLNKGNMLQLRRMNDQTPEFPKHNDHVSGAGGIAAFLYLSDGWTPDCGGRLCLYGAESDTEAQAFIEPMQNRFVAFETRPEHWHSVEPVRQWERLSVLSLWDLGARAE